MTPRRPRPRLTTSLLSLFIAAAAGAVPPRPDHVVIVVEENHSFSQVIGNPDAPYMNQLAQSGANFTNFFAITHPSQPNYLQFFSGSDQGVVDNTAPAPGSPFSTPNLGAALIAAGHTFVGYCEDLPEAGSTIAINGAYWRKHNPWVNWQVDPPGPNQLPSAVNQPFTSFPTDFDTLPDVAIVVPNQLNDMHDGTVAQADAWLAANIGPYAEWCQTHNSLLIVTWDEDNSEFGNRNRIPTMMYGPMIRPGTYTARWTLHNLQRTVAEMYGAPGAGAAASCRSIVGPFTADPDVATIPFQTGVGGYAATIDNYVESANPGLSHGSDVTMVADRSPLSHGLVRFEGLFGVGPGQVPPGSTVLSAKLLLLTGAGTDSSANSMSLYRMLTHWDSYSTWTSLASGISNDNVEAAMLPDFQVLPNVASVWAIFDVTSTVQTWLANPSSNHGWAILPGGSDGWRWSSAEAPIMGDRPRLEIVVDAASCRPQITSQPSPVSGTPAMSATFSVAATSTGAVAYQWRRSGIALIDDAHISGASGPDLTISPACLGDAGAYDCLVTNVCAAVASDVAMLTLCPADFNCSGASSVQDIFDFLAAYFAGAPVADINGTGGLSVQDMFDYLAAYFGAC